MSGKLAVVIGNWEDELTCHGKKAMTFSATMVAVFFVAALADMAPPALAAERAVTMQERPTPADIRIAKGRLSGTFINRPLFQVLEAIRSQAGVEYRGDKDDLNRPVSGTFIEAPLIDAVERILERFHYVIVTKANGEIRRLHIVGFRGPSAGSVRAGARMDSQTPNPESDPGSEPDMWTDFGATMEEQLAALTTEERLAFEVADEELGPPPELVDYFAPVPEPMSVGKRFSDLTTAQRRPFELADEKLGPPPELLDYFAPVPAPGSTETGPPVPPEWAP